MHHPASETEPEKSEAVKNEVQNPTIIPRVVELKRSLFTRSRSQDNIIIKRGKAQVLSGLSTDRKRRFLQRAQSEEPTAQRPLSPLVTADGRWRSKLTTEHAKESVKSDDGSNIPKLSSPEEQSKSEILSIEIPGETLQRADDENTIPFQLIPDKAAITSQTTNDCDVQELKTDTLGWHLMEESEDMVKSIDSADSDILYIDAEGLDNEFEDIFYMSSDLGKEIPLSSEIDSSITERRENKVDSSEKDFVQSEISDSDEEDIYSMFDSAETLRSLTPDKQEAVLLSFPPKPHTLQKILQMVSPEIISPESVSKSLPGSPSMSRGSWCEGPEEENQRSLSSPSISQSEPGYAQYLTQASAAKQRKIPYDIPQKKTSSTVLSSKSFDPFRSWTSANVPSSSTSRPLPMIHPSFRQPYKRSASVDSSDSWFNTYPRASLNTRSPLRDHSTVRSVSIDQVDLPLYRFRQLSQDPSMINLKAKRGS